MIHLISVSIIILIFGLVVYFFLDNVINHQKDFKIATLVSVILVIAFLTEPLRKFIFAICENVFNQEQYLLQKELQKTESQLLSQVEFEKLLKEIKKHFKEQFHVNWLQFVWFNRQFGRLENCYPNEKEISLSLKRFPLSIY